MAVVSIYVFLDLSPVVDSIVHVIQIPLLFRQHCDKIYEEKYVMSKWFSALIIPRYQYQKVCL